MKTCLSSVALFAVAALAQTSPMPAAPNVAATEQMPQMHSSLTQSLLSRFISYFDISHLSSVDTTTPVVVTHVFDPTMNKFTHLAMNVVQSGDVWYVPVCTIDSITTAGSAAAPAPESCQFGVQLASVPQNAMKLQLSVVRTVLRAIKAAAMEPSRFWFGHQPSGMMMMPNMSQQ
ncbi:hypothetical protein GGI21_000604 [Coemansia aciculifera]|nr:hypothetical protein GGI21_000604 [Coemansia aciculifera]